MQEKCINPHCICTAEVSGFCDGCIPPSPLLPDCCSCGHPACSKANGLEADWFATDQDGHIGMFISAGSGDIPNLVLSQFGANRISDQLLELPITGDASVLVKPSSESKVWISELTELSQRGIYCYDWSSSAYSLVASPVTSVKVSSMTKDLVKALEHVCFKDICFAETTTIRLQEYFQCI